MTAQARGIPVLCRCEENLMSVSISRMFALSMVGMAALAGCGGSGSGSSGGGGGTPTVVTWTSTGSAPAALATQIGAGAYTAATLQSGKLSISVPSGTSNYAVAYACPPLTASSVTQTTEYVQQASILDGASFSINCATTSYGTATLQVNAAAVSGGSEVVVSPGGSQSWSTASLSFDVQLPVGTYDVPVYVENDLGQVVAIRILRNQTIPGALNGGDPLVFASSDLTTLQPLSYLNRPGLPMHGRLLPSKRPMELRPFSAAVRTST